MTANTRTRSHWPWIFAIATFVIILIVLVAGRGSDRHAAFLIDVSIVAALLGGVLSILSPCSAAMLPIFFAYAFKERTQLIRMTFVFWLGLLLVFVPLGFGANIVGSLFIRHRGLLFNIAALIFLLYGIWALVGHGRSRTLPGTVRENPRSLLSVFLMGILTAFASGTCTAPILGAILTLAATQSSPILAFVLLGTYSFGLVVPLFLLAYGFERWGWKKAAWVRGKLWTIRLPGGRSWLLHSSSLITGILFLFLAWIFWFGRGTYLFLGLFSKIGAIDIVYALNERLLGLSSTTSLSIIAAVIVLLIVLARKMRPPSLRAGTNDRFTIDTAPTLNDNSHDVLITTDLPMEFKCASCGSTAEGEAGTCCGSERQGACSTCHNTTATCTCGGGASGDGADDA